MATQVQIAEHLDITDRQVRNLITSGVLPSGKRGETLDLDACRIAYINYLRGLASGTVKPKGGQESETLGQSDFDEGSLDFERYRLTRAQADAQELKNEIAKGQTAPMEIIQMVLSQVAGEAAGEIDAIPLVIRRRHPSLDNTVIEDIKRHCVKAQNAVSRTDEKLDDFLSDYLSDSDAA